MKDIIRLLLIVVVIGGVILYVFSRKNNTSLTLQTIDLAVDCPTPDNLLVASSVDVSVRNLSSRSHSDISVKLTAFDKSGKVLKEKYTTFSRTLPPNSIFDKPVTLPAGTKRCDCKIVSSHPIP